LAALVRRYGSYAAIGLLACAVFSGFVGKNIAFPVLLLVSACLLFIGRYWDEIKTLDFRVLDGWSRNLCDSISIQDWHTPYHAATLFCNPALVTQRDKAAAEMNAIMMELIKNPDRGAKVLTEENSSVPVGATNFPRDGGWSYTHYDAAQIEYKKANTALSIELVAILARGDLLAKGLLVKNELSHLKRIIPMSRWQLMALDIARANASGPGWAYTGIVIGKRAK
jgi:hypothetical protein